MFNMIIFLMIFCTKDLHEKGGIFGKQTFIIYACKAKKYLLSASIFQQDFMVP